MTVFDFIQIAVFIGVLIAITPLLGRAMTSIYSGRTHAVLKPLKWMESGIYKIGGIDPSVEMDWRGYLWAVLVFNLLGFGVLFFILIFQSYLPLNPQHLSGLRWDTALNAAISFMTNTNWQSYAGESTMSYFSQMVGLTVQNFVSAATGIGVLLVLIRGLVRHETSELGNFWVDLTRGVVYILLPLSIFMAIFLVSQGVVQSFHAYINSTTVEGARQVIPLGPAASQIAIKQLGTNGGGFFNTNSAHPFENPTPLTNFFEMLAILAIPAALTYLYGLMVGSKRQGRVLFIAMLVLFLAGLTLSLYAEHSGNPALSISHQMEPHEQGLGDLTLFRVGRNPPADTSMISIWRMEGKETRMGVVNSVLWSTATTSASNGSVNAMHSSLSPIAGGVALFNIMLGEIIFGGVGCGLYGMLLFVILTVFISGLMVGRTPEYLGKKIGTKEVVLAFLGILIPNALILLGSSLALAIPQGLSSLLHTGPHGLSEILYAFASAAGNNGSAFAGLNANTSFYNVGLGFCMVVGRFGVIVPVLMIAGTLAQKKKVAQSAGSFATDTPIFVILLLGVILIVGALTFFPALSLGPIMEHLLMVKGMVM